VRLNQPDFDNPPDIVAISIDPAFAPRTKLQQFRKCKLRRRSWIPNRILKVVWRRIWRGVGRWRI